MQFPPRSPLRIVVLISSGGTTLRNLIEKIAAGQLDARIERVISSNAVARGLEFAHEAGIPADFIDAGRMNRTTRSAKPSSPRAVPTRRI